MKRITLAFRFLVSTFLLAASLNAQNVGIGTTSPLGEFHISTENQATDPIFSGSGLNDFSVSLGENASIQSQVLYTVRIDNAGPNPNLVDVLEDGAEILDGIPINVSGFDIGNGVIITFDTPVGHTFADSWSFTVTPGQEDQLIVKNGNVGIGLPDPSVALEVDGDIKFSGKLIGNFARDFLLINRENRIGVNEMFGLESRNGGYSGMFINVEGNDPKPYYGFAVDGNARAWFEYESSTFDVVLDNNGGNLKVRRNTATKPVAGSWAANSDRRLKKNISHLDKEVMLEKVLRMQGVTYEWNDDKTNFRRPEGTQIGFIAQDLQRLWPEKISKDEQGYLITAYGDYDPVIIEAIKALNDRVVELQNENKILREGLQRLDARLNSDLSSKVE